MIVRREITSLPLRRVALLACTIAVCISATTASAAKYTLIPGYSGTGTETDIFGINDAGYMTGNITYADGSSAGFIRSSVGTYTLFSDGEYATFGRAINAANQITGYSYVDSTEDIVAASEFRRDADGTITLLHDPVTGAALHGFVQGINAEGVIVGESRTKSGIFNVRHGYILDGSSYTELSVSSDPRIKTSARGINDAGLVVGWTSDNTLNGTRGFVYSGGSFQQVVADPAAGNTGDTFLETVNNHGVAAGDWIDEFSVSHPFLYDTAKQSFTELTPPVGGSFNVFGINDRGQAVLTNSSGVNYLYDPSSVPEPAAWGLMIIGLSCVGTVRRFRNAKLTGGCSTR